MLLLLAIFQVVVWQHAVDVARGAATQGLEAGRDAGGSAADGQTATAAVLAQTGHGVLQQPKITVVRADGTATVTVSGTAVTVLPGVHLAVRATAAGALEEFRPLTGAGAP